MFYVISKLLFISLIVVRVLPLLFTVSYLLPSTHPPMTFPDRFTFVGDQQTVSWESVTWPPDDLWLDHRPLCCTVRLITAITIVPDPHEKTKVSATVPVLTAIWDRTACVQWLAFPATLSVDITNDESFISLTTRPQIQFLLSFRLSVVGNISISRIEISFEPELIDPTGTDLVFYPLNRLQKSFVKPQTKLGETLNGETLRLWWWRFFYLFNGSGLSLLQQVTMTTCAV